VRRYLLKRGLIGVLTLIGVSIIIFSASRLTGDAALLLAPEDATEEEIQDIRVRLGLDKPIPVQYYIFVKDALHGDFGDSIIYRRPAMEVFLERLPATLKLGIISFILGNICGILLGVLSATSRSKWIQWGGKTFGLLGQAIPNFWIAVMAMMIFAVYLHWLPTSGIGGIEYYVMPVACLSWFSMAFVMRITRSSLLDAMRSEYVKMARIKGNPEWIVIWKHAMKNALIPVVTTTGMQFAMLVAGNVFIETVFRWPGVGVLMVSSINSRDYPLLQTITIFITFSVVVVFLLVDVLYACLDPRIKYE
jgi:peptide/nickel transport system permease protein